MKRLALAALAVGSISAWAAQAVRDLVSVKILVYDYAGLTEQQLGQSLDEAASVFHKAGIDLKWLVGVAAINECLAEKQRSGEPVLKLNLLDERMGARMPRDSKELGFAQPEVAYIHVPRVQNAAQAGQFDFKVVLGQIIAHELGHVFLGPNAHSRSGLMSATLGKKELAEAHWGGLRFSPKEAERMRNRLSR